MRPSLGRPASSDDSLSVRESAQLAQFLHRPIVFQEPDRVVHPPSWLEHIPFAFWIVDVLRPAVFVELGTQSGNSYAGFAQAVQTLGLSTACYAVDTWRGDPQAGFYGESVFTEWASYHDRHFSAFSRLIRSSFEEAVQQFSDGSIDLLHIDGYHTYQSASADFARWRPKLSRRGVILIHDINVRERDFGTWRLWEELKAQSPSFEFLHGQGLGVVAAGPDLPEELGWLFSRSPAHPHDESEIRQFFSRMGAAISTRFGVGELERKLQAEIDVRVELAGEREAQAAEIESLTTRAQDLSAGIAARETRLVELATDREAQGVEIEALKTSVQRLSVDIAARETRLVELATDREAQAVELEGQLTREREQHAEALGRKTQLAAELQEWVRDESERRKRLEAERDRLASTWPARRLTTGVRHRIRRVKSGIGRRARYLRRIVRTPAALGLLPSAGRGASRSVLTFFTHPEKLREASEVVVSGLFDEAYYRASYPDVAASRLTPLAHFVLEGAREGRNPHPLFDGAYYLRRNPDVAAARVNPLLHYRITGAFEGRSPHPLFDVPYYFDTNADVKNARAEPLSHFLTVGAVEGRDPNPFFQCSYYLNRYPDLARSRTNPLVHFACHGWREGRRPSSAFDTAYYLSQSADVRLADENPLAHYLEYGRFEGRQAVADADQDEREAERREDGSQVPQVKLKVKSVGPARMEPPAVLCLSHVMPCPPRAGNEYRIHRLLRWLRDQGYRIVPVIAPLPGERVDTDALHLLAAEFSNAVLCDRDGRLEYVLHDVPDVLASLRGEFTRPVAALLDEDRVRTRHERQLLQMDRTFCHDALITTALRLQQVLRPCILLSEYIWMSRVLPLVSSDVLKVIDTVDVFSTKREKVLQFGIDDLHVEAHEEAKRLRYADLILAIQDDERQELEHLVPEKRVVTVGVDFDVVEDAGIPSGRRVVYIASDNPMNRRGLSDFLRFAWPHIRREVPDAELLVAGKVSGTMHGEVSGVIRLGPVDDLRPLYGQARVVINPAVAGTGLKIKTLEALGHLRPIVTWPNGTDGFSPELAAFCVTVHDWYEFSRRVAGLLAAEEASLFSRAERDTIVRLTSPATVYGPMTQAFEAFLKKPFGSELHDPGD
jgi:glycosyltransferase involved in cell wall biosynthesis